MKLPTLTIVFTIVFLSYSHSDAQTQTPQANVVQPAASPLAANPPVVPAQQPPTNSQQALATPNPPTPPPATAPAPASPTASSSPVIAPPADIAFVTAKEILSANNQVVIQIATMYQHLGLYITIIVTIVGVGAGLISYLARKSVHEFIQDWTRKMELLETEMKESLRRLRDSVDKAALSSNEAATNAQSIKDSETVLSKTLADVDQLRSAVATLRAELGGQPPPAAPPAAPPPPAQPPAAPTAAVEDAEVAARLKGKTDTADGGGKA